MMSSDKNLPRPCFWTPRCKPMRGWKAPGTVHAQRSLRFIYETKALVMPALGVNIHQHHVVCGAGYVEQKFSIMKHLQKMGITLIARKQQYHYHNATWFLG